MFDNKIWKTIKSSKPVQGLVYFLKIFAKFIEDSPSHRILQHMHKALNIDKK